MYASFWLRFNGVIPAQFKASLFYYLFLASFSKLFFLILYNLYDISWRFVGLEELIKLFKALSLGSLILGITLFLLKPYIPFKGFPRSILLLDYIIAILLIGSFRISKRILLEGLKNTLKMKGEKVHILVVGAGKAGEQIIREMVREKDSTYLPIGFVDDDSAKQGIKIHGIKVLGKREDIPQIVKNNKIDEVLIALPSAQSSQIKKIVEIIRESHTLEKITILPSTSDLMDGKVTLSDIHEIELEDLLGRDPVKIDLDIIKKFVQGKKVIITGAGGSIGSELTLSLIHI